MTDQQTLPLMLMPDQILKYGLEKAIMISVVTEIVIQYDCRIQFNKSRLYDRAYFFPLEKQKLILQKLISDGILHIETISNEIISLKLNKKIKN